MCKYFVAHDGCKKGKACDYAHGSSELIRPNKRDSYNDRYDRPTKKSNYNDQRFYNGRTDTRDQQSNGYSRRGRSPYRRSRSPVPYPPRRRFGNNYTRRSRSGSRGRNRSRSRSRTTPNRFKRESTPERSPSLDRSPSVERSISRERSPGIERSISPERSPSLERSISPECSPSPISGEEFPLVSEHIEGHSRLLLECSCTYQSLGSIIGIILNKFKKIFTTIHISTKKLLFEGYQLRITTDGELFQGAGNRRCNVYELLKVNFDDGELWDITDDDQEVIEEENGVDEGDLNA